MSTRREATGVSGILAVDKPGGMTSHDVVNRVRRITGERRVGHAGTLDPMATGLLVVLVGPATRLAPYLTSADKAYLARIVFGTQTDTDDADGRVIATAPVPDEVADPFFATGVIVSLVGVHEQVPPAFSAIKVGGKVAYREARGGTTLELQPRTVHVTQAVLTGIECTGEYAWDVRLAVSKGTYIRALARDLGPALGSVAHLGALRRVRSGELDVTSACTLEQLEDAEDPTSLFVDPFAALGLPVIDLDAATSALVADGRRIGAAGERFSAGELVALRGGGRLLAVYGRAGDELVPRCIIAGGVSSPDERRSA